MPTHRHALILGGARSGKSSFAERLAAECGAPVVYIATGYATDEEMAERIAHHRAQRPPTWRTIEARTELVAGLTFVHEVTTVLVEDLTLLLSNHMEVDQSQAEERTLVEVDQLLAMEVNVVLVSNEVGMGLVPTYPLGRRFRDALGRINQAAAANCSEVYFVVAGLPLRMK